MNLIIVESPTKSKTIGRFLGSGFLVKSSFGHVRDLPKSELGVDVKKSFHPKYVIPVKAKKVVSELKKDVAKAERIILATDPDREGEAIAWHLAQALNLEDKKNKTSNSKPVERVVFHEITKKAIEESLANPRKIDQNLVDAQQARRVLDRLVGYELSPFLWKKIRAGLSAGRVQSVALRLVVEREREIQNFKKVEYWSIEADLAKKNENKIFRARLVKIKDKTLDKLEIKDEKSAEKIIAGLSGAKYQVASVEKKEVSRTPPPPFTTSTLQQEASRKLGFSAKQTMTLAQRLYETGYITYMRTDSVNLSDFALEQIKKTIGDIFGREYVLTSPRQYVTKSKNAQEAHEAVRPTDAARLPDALKGELERGQARLYELIWKRAVASQMPVAVFDQTAVDITALDAVFHATGQVLKFDGFTKVYNEGRDEQANGGDDENQLPELKKGEDLNLKQLLPIQHFTEPPPRFTDATLVKTLEANGIGRPSTYAPTLSTIQDRGYVEKENKKYKPTEIGFLTSDMLVENFPEIVDINFTSHIEEELDDIADGKIGWTPVVNEFYAPFKKNLTEKLVTVEKHVEVSTTPCPHCGQMMVIKFGRFGKFLACPDPKIKVTLPLPEEAAELERLGEKTKDERCPLCGKPMEVKRGRFGYFLGCADYPKCKGITKIVNKTGFKCPKCGTGDVIERKSRGRGNIFYGCSLYPKCDFATNAKPQSDDDLKNALEKRENNKKK